ncbi:DUF2971 domain-containing protein [Sphingomonas daechungensis]|uniref:DUF2971 domain-containing protein n=1 Tax=Sphingomonas daechungensis TaxID=1176646 RepID=UPI0037847306
METLAKQKLVLLSPSKWDDSNDSYFMELYRNHLKAKSVLALCFTMAPETYHHWRIFTTGMEGVCLEFRRVPLQESLNETANAWAGPVDYLKIEELKAFGPNDLQKLPFVKRLGYRDEREWRIISQIADETKEFVDIPIQLEWINRIVLNPWIPPALVDNLRPILKTLIGSTSIEVASSRLTNSKAWKDAGKALAEGS